MINDISRIPGNDHALSALRGMLLDRTAIGFVGAGASAELYPTWIMLIQRLSGEAVGRGLATGADKAYWLAEAAKNPDQVVRGIRNALGPENLAEILQEMYSPRTGPDGNRFTLIQGSLLKLNLLGYVTTNYDSGLVEARHVNRPSVISTGYGTWQERDILQQWLTGEAFGGDKSPILFAHGIYQRTDSIVLGVDEYRQLYRPGLFRRTFQRLWQQDHLLVVGFSFTDPWFRFIQEEFLSSVDGSLPGGPRHIALVAIDQDKPYSPEMRRLFHDAYGCQVVFYPVKTGPGGERDHGALLHLLRELEPHSVPEPQKDASRSRVPKAQPLDQKWVHETTNDDRYVGHSLTLARLGNWAADPLVKLVAVTAMGGQGKTALVGHWLKVHGGDHSRKFDGLFYWSFYSNRSVTEFAEAFFLFIGWRPEAPSSKRKTRERGRGPKKQDVPYGRSLTEAFRSNPYLLVLDGLEVIQELPGDFLYGKLLEDDLRTFLDAVCRGSQSGLVVLTSRFPFTDLLRYLGTSARVLELDKLEPREGSLLLERSGVGGMALEREKITRQLHGHPLALRVFAAALSTQADGDPTRLWNVVFRRESLSEQDPLEGKLLRLLTFYERHLPPVERLVLGTVSLFRYPVEESILYDLVSKQLNKAEMSAHRGSVLDRAIDSLVRSGLLLRDYSEDGRRYSCHPVLRDHFRTGAIKKADTLPTDAARLLTYRPAHRTPSDLREIMPTITAIELLTDSGHFDHAHSLFEDRLLAGEVFLSIPAAHEGRRCALNFVSTRDRRNRCLKMLSAADVAKYLNAAGLFSYYAGEPADAVKYYRESVKLSASKSHQVNLSVARRNLAEMLSLIGSSAEAETAARGAVKAVLSVGPKDINEVVRVAALAELGFVLSLQGRIEEAASAFDEASDPIAFEFRDIRTATLWDVKHAQFLLRIGIKHKAQLLAEQTLKGSSLRRWNSDVARCQCLIGTIEMARGRYDTAGEKLAAAETIFRKGHMLADLAAALVAVGELHRRVGQWSKSTDCANEAIRISGPRHLILTQADALVLRGAVLFETHKNREDEKALDETSILGAMDDALAGLQLAQSAKYVWAERDALILLSRIWSVREEEAQAKRCMEEAHALSDQLVLRGQPSAAIGRRK